jgi:hypothetical protein
MSLDRSYGAHNASRVQELAVEREMFERRNHELQKTNGALQEEVRGSRLCVRACVRVCVCVDKWRIEPCYVCILSLRYTALIICMHSHSHDILWQLESLVKRLSIKSSRIIELTEQNKGLNRSLMEAETRYVYVCVCVCVCAFIFIFVFIQTHAHTHTHTQIRTVPPREPSPRRRQPPPAPPLQ